MSVADVLEKAADLCERGWTQRALGRDADGEPVRHTTLKSAKCFCASGAILLAADDDGYPPALRFFGDFIGGIIPHWNDAEGRTQAEVVAKLREAARKARGETSEG